MQCTAVKYIVAKYIEVEQCSALQDVLPQGEYRGRQITILELGLQILAILHDYLAHYTSIVLVVGFVKITFRKDMHTTHFTPSYFTLIQPLS